MVLPITTPDANPQPTPIAIQSPMLLVAAPMATPIPAPNAIPNDTPVASLFDFFLLELFSMISVVFRYE